MDNFLGSKAKAVLGSEEVATSGMTPFLERSVGGSGTGPQVRGDEQSPVDLLQAYGDRTSSFITTYPGFERVRYSGTGDGFGEIRYAQLRSYRFCAGEPLARLEDRAAILMRFLREPDRVPGNPPLMSGGGQGDSSDAPAREWSRRKTSRALAFPVGEALARQCVQRGAFAFKVGEEPIFELRKLFIGGLSPLDLVGAGQVWKRKGLRVEWLTKYEKSRSAPTLKELGQCESEWKQRFGMRELGFLSQCRPLERLEEKEVFVVRYRGQVAAFISAVPVPAHQGKQLYFADIVRGSKARHGMSEFLILEAMRLCAENGFDEVRLGMCPLAGLQGSKRGEDRVLSELPRAQRIRASFLRGLGSWVFLKQTRYYSFKGIYEFRQKLGPSRWEALYAVSAKPSVVSALKGFLLLFSPWSPWSPPQDISTGGRQGESGAFSETATSVPGYQEGLRGWKGWAQALGQRWVRSSSGLLKSVLVTNAGALVVAHPVRWVWRMTLLFCLFHAFKVSNTGMALYHHSAYVPETVLELSREIAGGILAKVSAFFSGEAVAQSIINLESARDWFRRVFFSALFHTTGFHFVGNLLSLWFFGSLLEKLRGRRTFLAVLVAGLLLSNPLTQIVVLGFISKFSGQGMQEMVQRFMQEWDYGSSNGVYACVGGLAACLKRPRVVLVPFIGFAVFLCIALRSWLSLHHLVGLALGYALVWLGLSKAMDHRRQKA